MSKQAFKVTFGDKFCFYCGLTVAEHINGHYVVLDNYVEGYLHEGCLEKAKKGACQ